jgi:hypothetical protein
LRYNDSQVAVDIYPMWHSRRFCSLSFEHVILRYMRGNGNDARNQKCENIAIYEKYKFWKSPSEPSRWDQGIARGINSLDARPDPLDLIIKNIINSRSRDRGHTSLSRVIA